MKHVAFTAFLAILGGGALAQTAAGNFTLNGYLGVTIQDTDNQASKGNGTSLVFAPSAGYFLKDRLEVGIGTHLEYAKNKSVSEDGTDVTKNVTTGISSYIKRYIPITGKLHFTASGNVGIYWSRNKMMYAPATSFQENYRTIGYRIVAIPGLTYFVTEKVGFSLSVGAIELERRKTTYESTRAPSTATNTATNFNATISPANGAVGMHYYFGCKAEKP
ncbi:hypothetical protein GCM10023188_05890 [Pontibacter saemangeumensis]|uniref:Outer membrane protein beta-barrel domain-containing protein n=1 Tax=Pontibacter saemangeumensis TaxID=1084525 RepID=A0ABP8L9K5_9BACT